MSTFERSEKSGHTRIIATLTVREQEQRGVFMSYKREREWSDHSDDELSSAVLVREKRAERVGE